jgi:hypothetical protein
MSIPILPEINSIFNYLWVPVLYAETHYRFKYFISYLHQAEPEIIADCPSRLKKDSVLPVLLIIKDAHRYPVFLHEIDIYSGSRLLFQQKLERAIQNKYEEIILEFPTRDLQVGSAWLNIKITYRIKQKIMTCWNDNHRGSSHAPLPVYISGESLPRLNNCVYGETHTHTCYTSDQVEFGASLAATARLASAMELGFFCATDHSYDLDDRPDNYLFNDPNLSKWQQFRQEVENFNKQNAFQIIPGEEVTVRNSQHRNVHCLVYNSDRFFHGSGDSAEKWLHTRSELSIPELLANLPPGACAFAAHPAEKPPWLQRLLINRSHWQNSDCTHNLLCGLQFINHSGNVMDKRGRQLWTGLLLSGFMLVGLAGNDAHGNFSRFRQIGFPFLTLRENYLHLFGYWRTGVYLPDGEQTMSSILEAMCNGACFMTNGPALSLQAGDQNTWQHPGGRLANISRIRLAARSSQEFSALRTVTLLSGFTGAAHERLFFQREFEPEQYDYEQEIDFSSQGRNGYIRAELITRSGKQALSNPIWFSA